MSKIQVSVGLKIHEDRLKEFKKQVSECILQVKKKDKGTIQYDWYLSSDRTECEIHEIYESSDAFLAHLSNLEDQLRILFKFATISSVIIYGDPSPELLEKVAARTGTGLKTYSFLQGFNK